MRKRGQRLHFGDGFLATFVSSMLGAELESSGVSPRVQVFITAVVGGTISETTGGNFANGAVTSAFVQMFNELGYTYDRDRKTGEMTMNPAMEGPQSGQDWLDAGMVGATIATLPVSGPAAVVVAVGARVGLRGLIGRLLGRSAIAAGQAAGLPVVAGARGKVAELSARYGDDVIDRVLTQGARFTDNAHKGTVNVLLSQTGGKVVRVTLDPTQSRIISAGVLRHEQVANHIISGRLVPLK